MSTRTDRDTTPRSSKRPAPLVVASGATAVLVLGALAVGINQTPAASNPTPTPRASATPSAQPSKARGETETAPRSGTPSKPSSTPSGSRTAPPASEDSTKTAQSPGTGGTTRTQATTGPIGDEKVEVQRASTAATGVVDSMNQVAKRGDGRSVGVERVATGFVLGELQAQAQEQHELGYRQVGEAKITSVKASSIKLKTSKPTLKLTVCVDVSGVDVLDASGKSLKGSLYNPGRPVKHIYGAEFIDNVWKIATHDIPDTQDCGATS